MKKGANVDRIRHCAISGISHAFILSGLCVAAAPAYGQDKGAAAPVAEAGRGQRLDEIVVHATKKSRADTLQSVAISAAAFGVEQLAKKNVVTLQDLGYSLPNVQLDSGSSIPGVANFTIRGMGVSTSTPSIDPTVGLFVDGIYLGVIYGSITDTFDLENVEVLRGPQGVLFGKNVTGGAVLVRTRRPDGKTRIRGRVGLETGLKYSLAGSVEGAVTDTLAAKLSVLFSHDAGSIHNSFLNRDTGKAQDFVIRPTIVFSPVEGVNSTLIFEHGESHGDGVQPQNPTGHNPLNPGRENDSIGNRPGFNKLRWNQLTSETNIDIAGGTLTNIFGYRDVYSVAGVDTDGTPVDLFNIQADLSQHQYSDELRWNGKPLDFWDLTLGLYYFNSKLYYTEGRELSLGTVKLAAGGNQSQTAYSGFVNNDLTVARGLTLTAGLRWNREEKSGQIFAFGSCSFASYAGTITTRPGSLSACDNVAPDTDSSKHWTNLIPKVGLQYQFSNDIMGYAHWTKGYRSGGYNLRSNRNVFAGPSDDEEASSYEAGIKSVLFDRRVRLNVAAFQTDYTNLQRVALTITNDGAGVQQAIINPADARIRGLEVESTFIIGGGFRLDAAIGLLDGKYTSIREDLNGDSVIDSKDYSLRLLRLPKFTGSVTMAYNRDIGDAGKIDISVNYNYRSSNAQNDNNTANNPAQDELNANIAFVPKGGYYKFSVYGRNLTDNNYPGAIAPLNFPQSSYFGALKRPRIFGVEGSFDF